jgi:hypothetical protein
VHLPFALNPGLEHPFLRQLPHVGEVQGGAFAAHDDLRGDTGRAAVEERFGRAFVVAAADAAAEREAGDDQHHQRRRGNADHRPQAHRPGAEVPHPLPGALPKAVGGGSGAPGVGAGVGAHLGHQPRAQLERRLGPLDALRQRVHRRRQPADLGLAALAALGVALQRRRLLGPERAQHVGGDLLLPALMARVAHAGLLAHASSSANSPRIFSKPNLMRPFTVPSGTPSIRAISDWLKPPKYASSITFD